MKITIVSAAFMAAAMTVLMAAPLVAVAQGSSDTLIVGVQNDTPNLHPWDYATNSVWKSFLWRQWTIEALFGLSPDGTVYPVLASSYDQVPGDLNVTVHIRQGVTFTDGQPMNATDVVFSYQILGFNSLLSDTVLKSIVWQDGVSWPRWNATTTTWGAANPSHVGIEQIDDYTVKFHLRQPYSMFFFGALTGPIMPAHIWKDHLVTVDLSSYVIPNGPGGDTVSQGTEFDYDTNFGTDPSETQATIGTGPWKLVQWTPAASCSLTVYDNYWGKSQNLRWQNKDWPYFPKSVKNMEFRIYGTLDVAVLALKSGEVHIVPWNLPIGFYNDLRRDPRMGFKIPTSDGFFYLAFNMRKAPFDDINFRRAISYAVDKDFIVDRLLGGFGIKGQLPISPINPAYINSSAVAPPFDLNQARSILDAAGYVDSNGDGWRELPSGGPLRYTILTPAKDYDPVRADAGISIANNLKAIELNIDSAPTAFDAIVSAVFTAVQFDMYILGWVSLGPFPELYLGDFFSCAADTMLGVGSNSPGYCNPEFEAKMTIMDSSMNDAARIQAAKDAEGILVRDLPYDTLYNTRQIEAFRADVWSGWTDVNGEIFNGFSIGVLGASSVSAPTGPLTISLNMPGTGVSGATTHFQVFAVQSGLPAGSVIVNVTATTGDTASATTNAQGYADVSFVLPTVDVPQQVGFIAVGTKGTYTGGDAGYVQVVPPNDVAQLALSTATPVVAPGGTATITAKVTNKAGTAIAGVPVEIIPELVLGTVSPTNVTTNALGIATFTYTAPPQTLIPNRNQYDYIKASVFDPTKLALPEVKKQTLVMGVANNAYDWYITSVQSVSNYELPPTAVGTVSVLVTKHDGTVVPNENVIVTMSNATALLVDAPMKLTNGAGVVSFTFTGNAVDTVTESIGFSLQRSFFAPCGVAIVASNGAIMVGYGGSMSLTSKFVNPNSPTTFTVTAMDAMGAPASGLEVNVFIPLSEVGNPVSVSGPGWTPSSGGGSNFTGTTNVAGQVTATFNIASFTSDSVVTLEVGLGGVGPLMQKNIGGNIALSYFYDGVVGKRNKIASVDSWSVTPVLLTPDTRALNVTVSFKDISGPAQDLDVNAYRGTGSLRPGRGATKIGTFITDANGKITVPWIEPRKDIDTAMGFTAVYINKTYAMGGQFGSVPFETYYPYLTPPNVLVSSYDPTPTIVRLGSSMSYAITVKDFLGGPVQDALVKARVAGNVSGKTDGTGHITLSLVPPSSDPTGTDASEVIFDLTKGAAVSTLQAGVLVGVGVFALSNLNIPSGSVGQKITISATVTNNGPLQDTARVLLSVDDQPFEIQEVTVDPNGGTATINIPWVPYDTSQHTLKLTIGASTVSGQITAGGGGMDIMTLAIVGIVLLIVGVIIGMVIGKRPKTPKPEEAPLPEEKPEEPKA